ncbi:MAG TPA: PAS domain-containing protein [Chthoniobacterales bacterium]
MNEWSPNLQKADDAPVSEAGEFRGSEEVSYAGDQRLQDILDNSTAVVAIKDLELRYLLVNREYERRFNVQRDQIRGKTDFEVHSHAVAEAVRANDWQVIEAGTPVQFQVIVPMAGGERHYDLSKFLLRDHAGKPYAICAIATDVTEQKRAEESQARRARQSALHADIHAAFSLGTASALSTMLQRSAEAFVLHLDAAFARLWTLNERQNVLELQASAGLCTRLEGKDARVALGERSIGLIAQERKPYLTNDVQNDAGSAHAEWTKQEGMVAFAGYPLLVEGRLVGVVAMFARRPLSQDTLEALGTVADTIAQGIERKRSEEKSARLNRTLQTLYQCNQAVVRATDEYELLRSVCRILVEVGGLRMAWVGYREHDDQKTVRPVAQTGYEDGYLEQVYITWADTERGRGPTGRAIRTGTASSNKDFLTDPSMAPWRAEALKRGFASSVALPLIGRSEAFGALALYAEEPDVFNESTMEQYTDLANNLAYGVMALRTREERTRAAEALRASEQRLQDIVDHTTAVVFVKDLELRYLLVNGEYERRHQVERREIRGKTDFDIHPRAVAHAVRANDRRVIDSGVPIQFEEAVPSAEGERWLISTKFLLRDHTGKPYAICGIATDITERKRAESEIRQLNALLEKRVAERTVELVQSNDQLKRAKVQLRKRNERVKKHRDVLLGLAHSDKSDFAVALRQICSASAAALEVARVSYWSLQENGSAIVCEALHLRSTESLDEQCKGIRLGFADCPAYFEALATNRPIVADRAVEHPATCGLAEGYLKPLGISSMLDAPVWMGGEVVGVLCHEQVGASREWSAEDIDFVSAVAAMVSLALQESHRARSERRLRESEEKFRALFEGTSQAVVLHDESGILEANPSWFRLLGYSRMDEVLGKHPAELSAPIQPGGERAEALAAKHITHALAQGSARFEWMMLRADGTGLPMEVFLTPIQLGGRQLIQAVCNDITARKRAEAELLRTLAKEKELGQLRNSFVSMVSHEFRTPLGIIQSSAEILEDYLEQLEPAERRDHLQSIRKNTCRMAGLMEEALLIGSLEAGKLEFKPAPLALQVFVRRLVDEVLSATDWRCPIEWSLDGMPAEIHADERLLRHVFTNLLTNAIKYSGAGQGVSLEIRCIGPQMVCAVRDHGIGIPEADREWLFSAFHRGGNVGERPGTGLGLVIVKRCLDLHGGNLEVQSEVGEGTAVTVRLPMLSPELTAGSDRTTPEGSIRTL